ncbi:hypothetical protein F4781DRAFT_196502 [Annulohypoxylon bovei var. microspora]|nr:hypothetical protein F4781DRAFT_196502 [Annulohypoxylon bovei var. microspora]
MPIRFCPLCDVLIDVWINPGNGLASPDHQLNWLQEVRAIRTTENLKSPFVTGVGWLESDECVIAPIGYKSHYRDHDPQPQLDDYFTGHQVSYSGEGTAGYWCYAVHNACWELLRDRIDPDHDFSAYKLARHLFALLYNTPVNVGDEALMPGHNYGNASEFRLQTGELYSHYFTRVKESDYFFITGDVSEKFEPNGDSLEDETLSFYVDSTHLNTYHGVDSESNALCLLPRELIMLVLAYLPSRDVCKLRLVSRYVADLSSPGLLDQKFWASRFGPEFEMGFVFAGLSNSRPTEPADWRTLYLKIKAALKSKLFYGLKNRRRIWHTFQHISDALYVRLENESWIESSPPPDTARPFPQSMVFAEALFESTNPRFPPTKPSLSLSCRLFEWRSFIWPRSLDSVPKRLQVSTIYSNGKTYISGLQDSYTVSIGDMELTDPGSGIAKLITGDNMRCIGFHLGLDACKIISISLMRQETRALSNSINKDRGTASQNLGPLEVWNPNIPAAPPVWHFPESSPTQYFNLCLNMNFGGPDGQLLQSLVRVDVLMGGYPSVFLGICFIYCDGSERLYGRKRFRNSLEQIANTPSIRQCFLIDGPRGEVMTKITVSRYPPQNTIQAITISTNFDRTNQFRLYGEESMGALEDKEIIQILQPEPGMHFTSFYAKVQSPLGHFRDFSARCQIISINTRQPVLGSSDVSHHIPIGVDIHESGGDMLTYPRGFAFTAANILGLRKIRVSVSDEKHIGVQGHISGLWLEYHDSDVPVILGQWIKELDTLDLPVGERVTEVITWHDYTNGHRYVKYGPIKKLRIGTVRGNTKEFIDSHRGGKSGILWGCNHEWDHVRVLYTPKESGLGTRSLRYSGNHLCPSWAVLQKIFMQEIHENGRPNAVTTIEITFKEIASEICGLTFIYEDGKHITLGVRGMNRSEMTLSSDERLAQIELGGDHKHHIIFMTVSPMTLNLAHQK